MVDNKVTDDEALVGVLLLMVAEPITMVPVWILDNEPGDKFIRCLLGSEPPSSARAEEVPREAIVGRPTTIPAEVRATMKLPEHLSHLRGLVFAILQVRMSLLSPDMLERIKQGCRSCSP